MKKAEKPKYVLRLPPCPDYDVEGTECWLTDLAREGLLLKKDGLFAPNTAGNTLRGAVRSTSTVRTIRLRGS